MDRCKKIVRTDGSVELNDKSMEKEPTEPYTDDDLNWTNADSSVSREHAGQSNQIKSAAQRFSL